MFPLMAAGAIAPIAGGIIGSIASSGDAKEAARLRQQALEKIQSVQDPDLQAIMLSQYKQAGVITPQDEKAITTQDSELKKIQVDPTYKLAQKKALGQLQDLGEQPLTVADRAAIEGVNLETDRAAKGRRQAILEQMASRGMGGGGSALAAQLQASQDEANQAAQRTRDLTQMALQRQIQAVQGAGEMGTQLGGQQFNQQAQQAQAQDLINRFNTQSLQGAQQRNIERNFEGQKYNLNTQQDIANKNVGIGNQQTMYNQSELPQMRYTNALGTAKAQAGALGGMADQKNAEAARTQQMWSNIGSGVGSAAGAVGNYQQAQNTSAYQQASLTPEQQARYNQIRNS